MQGEGRERSGRADGLAPARPQQPGQRPGHATDHGREGQQPEEAQLGGRLHRQGMGVERGVVDRPLLAPDDPERPGALAGQRSAGEHSPGHLPVLVAVALKGRQATRIGADAGLAVPVPGARGDEREAARNDHNRPGNRYPRDLHPSGGRPRPEARGGEGRKAHGGQEHERHGRSLGLPGGHRAFEGPDGRQQGRGHAGDDRRQPARGHHSDLSAVRAGDGNHHQPQEEGQERPAGKAQIDA